MKIELAVDKKNVLKVLKPNKRQGLSEADEVERALDETIGVRPIEEFFTAKDQVMIRVCGITGAACRVVLLQTVCRLHLAGILPDAIVIAVDVDKNNAVAISDVVGEEMFEAYCCVDVAELPNVFDAPRKRLFIGNADCEEEDADFSIYVFVDEKMMIVAAAAGEGRAAKNKCREAVVEMQTVVIERKADIVVVATEKYPKDVQLLMVKKALDNAQRAVRDDGVIIWLDSSCACDVAVCEEEWQKTLLEARAEVLLVSKNAAVSGLPLYKNLNDATNAAFEKLGGDAKIIVMPQGESIIPTLRN